MLAQYQSALGALQGSMGAAFQKVRAALLASSGAFVFVGVGKSGFVAQKLSSSFASTGRRSFFLHPTEAAHGSLGAVHKGDVLFALSFSGNSSELGPSIDYAKTKGVTLVAITANADSFLAVQADHVLFLPKVPEICPLKMAPTTSSLLMMALGDVLMACYAKDKKLTQGQYNAFHPSGQLGFDSLPLKRVMRSGGALPTVASDATMDQILLQVTEKRMGCAVWVDDEHKPIGILTDGDLRRLLSQEKSRQEMFELGPSDVMTKNPVVAGESLCVLDAKHLMAQKGVSQLCVCNEDEKLQGMVHWTDLLMPGG